MKNKIKFQRDKETGELVAYKDGKKVSEVKSMGDDIKQKEKKTVRK